MLQFWYNVFVMDRVDLLARGSITGGMLSTLASSNLVIDIVSVLIQLGGLAIVFAKFRNRSNIKDKEQ